MERLCKTLVVTLEASGKSDFTAPLVCTSSSSSGEFWCVCRGKTPHLSLAQAAGRSSCVVPPKCLSGEVEGRAGGVCGLQVCLNSNFFTEPDELANLLSADDSGKPSLCNICGISSLVSVMDQWEAWESLILAQ